MAQVPGPGQIKDSKLTILPIAHVMISSDALLFHHHLLPLYHLVTFEHVHVLCSSIILFLCDLRFRSVCMLEQLHYFVSLFEIVGKEAISRLFPRVEDVVVEEGLRLSLALTVEDGRPGGVLRRQGGSQSMDWSGKGLRYVWGSMVHDCDNGRGNCGCESWVMGMLRCLKVEALRIRRSKS